MAFPRLHHAPLPLHPGLPAEDPLQPQPSTRPFDPHKLRLPLPPIGQGCHGLEIRYRFGLKLGFFVFIEYVKSALKVLRFFYLRDVGISGRVNVARVESYFSGLLVRGASYQFGYWVARRVFGLLTRFLPKGF
jgi:hypothetical protein